MLRWLRPWRENRSLQDVSALLLILLGIVSGLAILSYSATDATWFFHQPQELDRENWFGRFGGTLAEALLQVLGTASFLVPWLWVDSGWRRLRRRRSPSPRARTVATLALIVALCALLDLLYGQIRYGGEVFPAGGYLGWRVAGWQRAVMATPGALLLSTTALLVLFALTTRFSLARSAELLAAGGARSWPLLQRSASRAWQVRASFFQRHPGDAPSAATPLERQRPPVPPTPDDAASSRRADPPAAAAATPTAPLPAIRPRKSDARTARRAAEAERQSTLPIDPGQRSFSLPPIDLLAEPEPQAVESQAEMSERARQITEKLREFQVLGQIVAIHPGPVVTTFEFKPDSGVKYSKIVSMTDDLSLALRAESVRIDRLPGRSTVGIEVPNRRQETIFARDLFGSDPFRGSASLLTLALGKDISGDVFTAELDRMPHLLIAGATGSGKSVGLNAMIVSILYKATPQEVRFIMIDTKMIELGVYAGIPHLLVPVVTEPKQASTALKWAVREMEGRYRKLAAVGVRNIAQFNELIAAEPERTVEDPRSGERVPLAALPYIVIVIDELADLMMVSSADVEESIMRLAQMARAVGIHLILATQRPSVDVITGTIKANFPSRIAFRVSQRVDSRTIIDQQGAEHLLGRGDMLFLKTGTSRLIRVHGSLLTEAELQRITTYVKKMAEPVYDESVLSDGEDRADTPDTGERDEMYARAVRTVIQEGKCSITLIQRRLQLGYARAARIVDIMQHEGVVSPGDGSKPREILVGPEYLETLERELT